MSLLTVPRTAKWPFFLGDALLIGLAWFFYARAEIPFNGATLAACVACVAIGAVFGMIPFLLDYRAEVRLAESEALVNTVDQIRGLETVATAIASATAQWQGVHEKAAEAAGSARQVSEKMNTEMQSFMEFFEKANHSERQHLTLEVEKLKRAEADWLGVLVRILDHVFAIHGAARRAGQQKFADQLAQLQFACRDAARRVGLTPHEAERGELFDSKQHQVSGPGEVPEGARVAETLACGFTFRGQMIRPAAVALAGPSGAAEADGPRSRSEPVDAGSSSGEAPTQQELPTASS